eukprot:GHVQ01043014.1.p1 GENE.GHVQ01043014.1~~GHVQ01043014.1.p1  ORF type:complete len:623 (+),score=110.28 GHVQ01043014.1:535-2403(+)
MCVVVTLFLLFPVCISGLSWWMHSYKALFIGRLMSGVGEASFITVAPPMIQDYGGHHQGRWLSGFYAMIPFGTAVGFGYGSIVASISALRWPMAFLLLSVITVPLALLCFQLPNELGRPKASRQPSSSSCPPLCSGSQVPPHHLPAEFTSPQTSLPVEALASSPPTPAVGSSSSTDSSQLLTGHTSTTSTSLHTRGGPWYGALCAHCCSFLTYCSSTLRYRWSVLSPPHWACLVSPSESPFLRNCLDVFSSVPFVLLTVVCLAPYAAVLMSVSSFGSAFLLQLGYAKEQTDGSLWMGGVAASAGFLGTLVGGVWSDWDAVKRGRWTTKGGSEGGVRGGLWWRWCGWRGREEEERLCDEDGGEPVGGMGRGGDRMEAVMIRYWEACRFSRKGIEAWSVRDYEVVDTSIVATATCSTTYDSVDAVEGLKSVSSSSGGGMRRNNGDDGEAYVSNGREVCGVVSLEDLLDEDKAGECNDVMTLRRLVNLECMSMVNIFVSLGAAIILSASVFMVSKAALLAMLFFGLFVLFLTQVRVSNFCLYGTVVLAVGVRTAVKMLRAVSLLFVSPTWVKHVSVLYVCCLCAVYVCVECVCLLHVRFKYLSCMYVLFMCGCVVRFFSRVRICV